MKYSSHYQLIKRLSAVSGSLVIILTILIGLIPGVKADSAIATNPATFHLNPGSLSLQTGQQFKVDIKLDSSGYAVDSTRAELGYDSNVLQYVSTDVSHSVFPVQLEAASGGVGSTSLVRGTTSPVSGDVLVATLSFKALTPVTDTIVYFKNTSKATSQGAYIDLLTTGATYTFTDATPGSTTPDPPANTSTGSTTGSSQTKSSSVTPKPTKIVPITNSTGINNSTLTPTATQSNGSSKVASDNTTNNRYDAMSIIREKVNHLPFSSFFAKKRNLFIVIGTAIALIFAIIYISATSIHHRALRRAKQTQTSKPTDTGQPAVNIQQPQSANPQNNAAPNVKPPDSVPITVNQPGEVVSPQSDVNKYPKV